MSNKDTKCVREHLRDLLPGDVQIAAFAAVPCDHKDIEHYINIIS